MPLPGEAVMYRNFIDRAGPRAIGVGYDEGLNLAFDANQMRLAILWRGEFMDGGRHWTGRGQGFQPPAGEEAFYFPNGDAFANLKKSDDPWPDPEERSSLVRFRGYHLNQRQQPTFRYSIGASFFEDFCQPTKTEKGNWSLVRRIEIKRNGEDLTDLYLRVGVGAQELDDKYLLSDSMECMIKRGAKPILVRKSGHSRADGDLRIPLSADENLIHIVYSWP
jgi:hypothetical protein